MSEITPFEIEIAEDVISDLKDRLSRTRWPDKETVDDWTQGVPLAYQEKLMDYWLNEYDFQRLANRLNQYDNFHTGIDNLSLKHWQSTAGRSTLGGNYEEKRNAE